MSDDGRDGDPAWCCPWSTCCAAQSHRQPIEFRQPGRSALRDSSGGSDPDQPPLRQSTRRVSFMQSSSSSPDLTLALHNLSFYSAWDGEPQRQLSPASSIRSFRGLLRGSSSGSIPRPLREDISSKELRNFASAHIPIDHDDCAMIKACRAETDTNPGCANWPHVFKERVAVRVAIGLQSKQERGPDGNWRRVYPYANLEERREDVIKATKVAISMRNDFGVNTPISEWKMFDAGLRLWPMRFVGYSTCGFPVVFDRASFMPPDIAEQFQEDPDFQLVVDQGKDVFYAMRRHCLRVHILPTKPTFLRNICKHFFNFVVFVTICML